jgi:hypothetical protein
VVKLKRTFQNISDELITDERLVIYFGTCSMPPPPKKKDILPQKYILYYLCLLCVL